MYWRGFTLTKRFYAQKLKKPLQNVKISAGPILAKFSPTMLKKNPENLMRFPF